MKTRIYFLDNLRTFLIFLVVVIHSGLVYEAVLENTWIVIDPNQAPSIGLIRMYLDLFIMFSIFFISGYFIPYSVEGKSSFDFVKSKFKRIMIPWILAVFTLIPAYKVVFLYSRGLPQEDWYSYFHFFFREGGNPIFFADNPVQNWLWFLPVLFIFQMAYLSLSRFKLYKLKISIKSGVILLFVLGLISSMIISEVGLKGWYHSYLLHFQRERILIYFMAFILGALCNKLGIFSNVQKNTKFYIMANVALTMSLGVFTVVALNLFFNMIDPARNYYFISGFADRSIYYASALVSMLSFLYILIHVFRFNFNKINTLMRQLNKSSYSVYIIHVIVMGILALPLLSLHLPGFVKFVLLTVLTYVLSNSIVFVYQRWFKENYSLRIAAFTIMVASLFGFIQFGNKMPEQNEVRSIHAPSVGLHEAVISGNLEAVNEHIKSESNLDEKDPAGGSSPLLTAAVFGRTEIALALIEAGANLNLRNNEGSTPLITAVFFCRKEIVEALLDHGADKTIKNNAGSTALDSVIGPFESAKPIYDYFVSALASLGLELDYEYLRATRPVIAEMLK